MNHQNQIAAWKPILFAAMAGGMGWGIRGQYGHETGAMIAGLLVSLTLIYLLAPKLSQSTAFRAAAWGTIAMGFGGSQTYGQTLGFTQNAPMIGNWDALYWGMFGLVIKGGMWIAFAGVFLGMGLGGIRYHTKSILILMISLVAAFFLGCYVLNSPFDPANKLLPYFYFSADWRWEPGAELKPREEFWGGMIFAFIAVMVYVRLMKQDRLAFNLGLWGLLGGAIGFPLGQCLQAFHAWNPAVFDQGIWLQYDQYMNWWNMMEITFGTTMGAFLGLGLWLNRNKIANVEADASSYTPLPIELILLLIHLGLLLSVEFMAVDVVDMFYDHGLILGLIPIVAVTSGRLWSVLMMFPITLIPIAGKTVRNLVYREASFNMPLGWILYLGIPLVLAGLMAWWFIKQDHRNVSHKWIGYALLFNAWLYFLLNYALFHFPFPWADWTSRTPSGIIFTVCILGLTFCVFQNKKSIQ